MISYSYSHSLHNDGAPVHQLSNTCDSEWRRRRKMTRRREDHYWVGHPDWFRPHTPNDVENMQSYIQRQNKDLCTKRACLLHKCRNSQTAIFSHDYHHRFFPTVCTSPRFLYKYINTYVHTTSDCASIIYTGICALALDNWASHPKLGPNIWQYTFVRLSFPWCRGWKNVLFVAGEMSVWKQGQSWE